MDQFNTSDQSNNSDSISASSRKLDNFEMSKLFGQSFQDILSDPIVREVFKTVTIMTIPEATPETKEADVHMEKSIEQGKVSFDQLNEYLSHVKESEVLRSVKELEKTPLVKEEMDLDLSNPTECQTYYSIAELPPQMEEHLDLILQKIEQEELDI